MQYIFQYLYHLKQKLLSEAINTQLRVQGAGVLSLWPLKAEPQSFLKHWHDRKLDHCISDSALLKVTYHLFLPHSFHFNTQLTQGTITCQTAGRPCDIMDNQIAKLRTCG